MTDASNPNSHSAYTVVARRYRPKSFKELIGQEHIAQALSKAIATGRVGHAYLFTGARGVGKTSTARIFAKALNSEGMAPSNSEDLAEAIDAGEDIDVIEIDGASNRGIEEIRQLRANVTVRPSRARFKIYIIDEVHMLTSQAFNALLKTLEEPPEHVKFIFCTTDPDKIPITVLSRCQRFDFVPVKFESIQQRLKEIATAEGFQADDEALALLARKAAGSMRDSQSLLEQVMSFSSGHITTGQVHELLGTADETRLLAITEALRDRNALRAFSVVEEALRGGADPGQLAEQMLNYLRDVMTAGIGGTPDLMRLANPVGHPKLKTIAQAWGIQTILAAIQVLDESIVRMRSSVSSTTLLEVAMVQICQLQDLSYIPALLEAIQQGGPLPASKPAAAIASPLASTPPNSTPGIPPQSKEAATTKIVPAAEPKAAETSTPSAEKKNASEPQLLTSGDATKSGEDSNRTAHASQVEHRVAPNTPQVQSVNDTAVGVAIGTNTVRESNVPAAANSAALESPRTAPTSGSSGTSQQALEDWKSAVASIDGILADYAAMAQSVEPLGSDQWTVYFPPGSQKTREYCEVPERRGQLQQAVQRKLGRSIRIDFAVRPGLPPKPTETVIPQSNLRAQKLREASELPFIKKVIEVLGAEVVRVDSGNASSGTRVALPPSDKHATA